MNRKKIRQLEGWAARLAGVGLAIVGVIILVNSRQASIWFGVERQSDVIPVEFVVAINVVSFIVASSYATLFANRGPYALLIVGGVCALGLTNRFASIISERFGAGDEVSFSALLFLMFAMLALFSVVAEIVLRHVEKGSTGP